MADTIYLIFTQEGFTEVKATLLEQKVTLWVNSGLLTEKQLDELKQSDITVHTLPDHVNASNDKSVISALKYVEQQSQHTEIFVEYM